MKICTKCRVEKGLDRFLLRKDRKCGINHICKDCLNAARNERNKNRKDILKKQNKIAYEKHKEKRLNYQKEYQRNLSEEKKIKRNERVRKWYLKNRESQIEKRKNQKERLAQWSKEYKKRIDQEKLEARKLLSLEVQRGNIIRPNECSICDTNEYRIEGHHEDYSNPLDVIWLCTFCHRAIHRELKKQER